MTKLTLSQKQKIAGGLSIGGATIQLVHGIITLTWVALEMFNIISDHLPKNNPKKQYPEEIPVRFENNLISSKITISS